MENNFGNTEYYRENVYRFLSKLQSCFYVMDWFQQRTREDYYLIECPNAVSFLGVRLGSASVRALSGVRSLHEPRPGRINLGPGRAHDANS
jgi:hypothetical protein